MLRSIYLLFLTYSYTYYLQLIHNEQFFINITEGLTDEQKKNAHFFWKWLSGKKDGQKIDERVFQRYREYLADENTIKGVWTSIIYMVDVVYDWMFVVKLYKQKESDLFIPSLIFAILGTILYLLDAFDVFQWLNLCSSGNAWKVTFCNFMLEDLPQMVITGIAAVREKNNIFTTTIIINLFTSIFALITKCVAIQESWVNQDEELIFPNLHSFVKKNQKLAEILVKEDIKIFPGKLERLINVIIKGMKYPTFPIHVKTDMPGGVIALVQSFENIKQTCIDKEEQAEIIVKFEDRSKMSTLEVSHLVVKMIEMKDVLWKLDLRECSIGTSTAKKQYRFFSESLFLRFSRRIFGDLLAMDIFVSEFLVEKKIVYEGDTIFGLQLLLRQTGLILRRLEEQFQIETYEGKLEKKSDDIVAMKATGLDSINTKKNNDIIALESELIKKSNDIIAMRELQIQVFRKDATDVRLENIVLDEFVIKGLCHVLKFATNITTLIIINDYNNGTTQEEAGNQFGIIKEEILRFDTKHITRFDYSYDNNRKVQWAYAEDGGLTTLQLEELENKIAEKKRERLDNTK